MRKELIKSYLIITFIVVELLSMVFNFYFVTLYVYDKEYPCNFSVVFFCLGFFIVDIVADYFSPSEANYFVYYKLFSQILFLLLGNIAIWTYGLHNTQIEQIFHKSPLVIIAGLIATYAGFRCTSRLMSYMKIGVYQGASVFKRYLFSTIPGEILFSLIFTFLCFYQYDTFENLFNIFITSAFIKIILACFFAGIMSLYVKTKYFGKIKFISVLKSN